MYGMDQFENELKELRIVLSDVQKQQFEEYYKLLVEWNEVMNLTAITDYKDVMKKHFFDSLTVVRAYPEILTEVVSVIDIGTGAGFPGIPLKIAFPQIRLTLLDSLQKRLKFLQEVSDKLELGEIQMLHGRAEDYAKQPEFREHFDLCVSRAVANLSTLSEYLIPLVKVGGKCICMKAANATEEIDQAKKAISILCGAISKVDEFCLPQSDIGRTIIEIKKEKQTPNKYPRKAGLPSKEPIK